MPIQYNGTFDNLKYLLKTTSGQWSPKLNGKYVFRSDDGGVLNWWPSTGTIQLQGKSRGRMYLEDILSCHLAKTNSTLNNLKIIIQHNSGGAAEAVHVYMKLQQLGLEYVDIDNISIEQV